MSSAVCGNTTLFHTVTKHTVLQHLLSSATYSHNVIATPDLLSRRPHAHTGRLSREYVQIKFFRRCDSTATCAADDAGEAHVQVEAQVYRRQAQTIFVSHDSISFMHFLPSVIELAISWFQLQIFQ